MNNDIGAVFGGLDGIIRQCEKLSHSEKSFFSRGFYEVIALYLKDYKRLKESTQESE